MKRLWLGMVCLATCTSTVAADESKAVSQLEKGTSVLNEIMAAPDKAIPNDLFRKAVCVGIVPAEVRIAVGIGGTYGRGVLVCRRGGNGPWGAPSLFRLGGANIGFQLGGKATDVVFLVMNASGAKKLVADDVKLGADASAAAGPVGRTAEGATDAQMNAEILSYSRTKGLFAGVSLEGAVFKQDAENNEKLYRQKLQPKQILIEGSVKTPVAARPLDNALTKYSPHGGAPFGKS
jgi:SH3 domain-containing YSC84-like protein 1